MQLAKTVTGIYVLEDGEVVDSAAFSRDDLPGRMQDEHDLEREYGDAERVVLSTAEVAELSGSSVEEVRERQRSAALEMTRNAVSEAGGRDQLLVQAVRALEDLDERNNELSERLRPWYALHFPELDDEVSDNEEFAALVADHAHRRDMEEYEDLAEDSTGMGVTADDTAMLERF
ncbi:MAG: hypothetical protein SVW02_02850, partial [Candidatus Nanohaloarchaea archaeon]|nr:hypothetical protein [Candidatus Nanohaloarchaea archaeon]